MSVNITISDLGCCDAHDHNFTYNYSPALREAGLPAWKYLNGLQANIVAILIGRAQIELKQNRDRCEPLIKGGGEWGTWDYLMEGLTALLKDLDKHPRGQVFIHG